MAVVLLPEREHEKAVRDDFPESLDLSRWYSIFYSFRSSLSIS